MLPAKLYRIQHAKSRATFDEEGDLVAKLVFYTPHAVQQWRDCLAAHLQWNEVGTDSPLLSTFDSAWRALEWGEVLARHRLPGEQHVVLYEIDTAKLGDTAVFHAKSSLLGLAMKPPSRLTDHEYLLLHRVPTQAIRVVQNVSNPLFHGMFFSPPLMCVCVPLPLSLPFLSVSLFSFLSLSLSCMSPTLCWD